MTKALTFDQWWQQQFGAGVYDVQLPGALRIRTPMVETISSNTLSTLRSAFTRYKRHHYRHVLSAPTVSSVSPWRDPLATGITLGIEVTADLSAPLSWSALSHNGGNQPCKHLAHARGPHATCYRTAFGTLHCFLARHRVRATPLTTSVRTP